MKHEMPDYPSSIHIVEPESKWPGISVLQFHSLPDEFDIREGDHCLSLSVVDIPAKSHEVRLDGVPWRSHALYADSICYTPAHTDIGLRWTSTTEAVTLMISPEWLFQNSSQPVPRLPDRSMFGLHDPLAASLIRCVAEDCLAGSPYGLMTGEAFALAALARLLPAASQNVEQPQPVVILRAIEFIHAHLDQKISVAEVAAAAGFEGNLFSFLRLFKTACGEPPHKFVISARLLRAREMLEKPGANVTTVALACGFSSASHFSVAFKRKWGYNPSALAQRSGPA